MECPYCHTSMRLTGEVAAPVAPASQPVETPDFSPAEIPSAPVKKRSGCLLVGLVFLALVFIVTLVVLGTTQQAVPTLVFGPTATPTMTSAPTPTATPSFATQLLAFGSGAAGPGQLDEPEHIGVDGQKNIYVGNTGNGGWDTNINIFDATGNFTRTLNPGSESALQDMGVAPDGKLYVVYNDKVLRLDAHGKGTALAYAGSDPHASIFDHLAVGPDGSVVASNDLNDIVRFDPQGKVDLVIKQPFPTVLGVTPGPELSWNTTRRGITSPASAIRQGEMPAVCRRG